MYQKKWNGISRQLVLGILVGMIVGASITAFSLLQKSIPAQQVVSAPKPAPALEKFKVSGNNPNFDAYFLIINAGKDRNIWVNNGLDPEFVYPNTPRGLSAADIKQLVSSGIGLGIAVPSEVLLARSLGAPVRVIAG